MTTKTDFSKLVLEPQFDIIRDENHRYSVEGARQDSVTQILGSHFGIEYYHQTEFYKERGSEVDRCCVLLMNGELDWSTMDPRVEPYVEQFQNFLEVTKFKPLAHHAFVYNPELWYAGELDLLGTWNYNPYELILPDIKTGSKMPHYRLQTGFYADALPHTYPALKGVPFTSIKRYCLYLGTKGYKLDHHKNNMADYSYGRAIAIAHKAKGIYK